MFNAKAYKAQPVASIQPRPDPQHSMLHVPLAARPLRQQQQEPAQQAEALQQRRGIYVRQPWG